MLFDKLKNIDPINSKVAILEDYDVARWNNLARRTNTKTFIQLTGRQPRNYEEVLSYFRNEKAVAGNNDLINVTIV